MTVVIPDDSAPADDTNIVVAPVIVNSPPAAEPEPVEETEVVAEVVEAVVETEIDLAVKVGQLEERVFQLELSQASPVVEEPAVVVEESGDGDVIVTGDDSPVGIPWTHKKPSLFGGGN